MKGINYKNKNAFALQIKTCYEVKDTKYNTKQHINMEESKRINIVKLNKIRNDKH